MPEITDYFPSGFWTWRTIWGWWWWYFLKFLYKAMSCMLLNLNAQSLLISHKYYCVCSRRYASDLELSMHWILKTSRWGHYCDKAHVPDRETEEERNKNNPGSYSEVTQLELESKRTQLQMRYATRSQYMGGKVLSMFSGSQFSGLCYYLISFQRFCIAALFPPRLREKILFLKFGYWNVSVK